MVTMVLALSVSRMVKVHTIVKRLPSVETLGSVSVVCSDKTGTLTQNKMSVTLCYTEGSLYDADSLNPDKNRYFLEGFALCNDAVLSDDTRVGDPTELALLDLAAGYRLFRQELERTQPRKSEIAFSSDRKMMTTLHRRGHPMYPTLRGPRMTSSNAPNIFYQGLTHPYDGCTQKESAAKAGYPLLQSFACLGSGDETGDKTPSEENLVFVGLAGMKDPIRPEALKAVQDFKNAGVRTVMITGDRIDTAFAIARELGIATRRSDCMTVDELETLSDSQLPQAAAVTNVYAHVSPEHKVRIVTALKSSGQIVAMTGDGVNDAPSLKTADVGIAMGITGTDVAKNAADIILTDDNFATIGKAIAEGRSIYENIKKSVLFLLSSNFGRLSPCWQPSSWASPPLKTQPYPVDQPDYRLSSGSGSGCGYLQLTAFYEPSSPPKK